MSTKEKCQLAPKNRLIEMVLFSTNNKSFEKEWLQKLIIDNQNYVALNNFNF